MRLDRTIDNKRVVAKSINKAYIIVVCRFKIFDWNTVLCIEGVTLRHCQLDSTVQNESTCGVTLNSRSL